MKKWMMILLSLVLCLSLFAGCSNTGTPGGEGGGEVPGEYYDAGNVSAFIPKGWTAFPVADVFADDGANDPDAVTICKDGKDDFDLLTKPFVRIDFYGPDSIMQEPDPTWYSDTEVLKPMKLGDHTWNGFTAVESDKKLAVLWTDVEGDVQYQASVWLDASEGSITLEDADVRAILEKVKPSDGSSGTNPDGPDADPDAGNGDADALSWWEGEWYGWWCITDAKGQFEPADNYAWDAYAVISADYSDDTAALTLWDTEMSKDEPLMDVSLYLSKEGGEHGVAYSAEGDLFTMGRWIPEYDVEPYRIKDGDWRIDPADSTVSHFENMIEIEGEYTAANGTDSFTYYIFLRPWGTSWEDVRTGDVSGCIYSDMMPVHYDDWYAPLQAADEFLMPDSYDDGKMLLE